MIIILTWTSQSPYVMKKSEVEGITFTENYDYDQVLLLLLLGVNFPESFHF